MSLISHFHIICSFKRTCHELPWRLPLPWTHSSSWSEELSALEPSSSATTDTPPPRSLGFSSTVRPSLGLKMSSIHTCARFDLHNRGLINVSDPSKSSVGATKLATVFHQCWPIAVFWAWRWGSCSRSWYLQPQCVLFEMTSYTNNFRRSLCMYLSRIASVSIYVFIYLFIWQSCGALS